MKEEQHRFDRCCSFPSLFALALFLLLHDIQTLVAVEMFAPVAVIHAGDLHFSASGMKETVVADIDADMGNPRTIRIFKEYKVADLR